MIISTLYRYQKKNGYLSRKDLTRVAAELNVPLHRVQSLVSFFPHFRTEKPPKVCVHVCRDMSCHMAGSLRLADSIRAYGSKFFNEAVEVTEVSCLGRCDRAPAAMVNDQLFVQRDATSMRKVIDKCIAGGIMDADSDRDETHNNAGDWKIDIYDGEPDYRIARAIAMNLDPARVIKALETAGLLGMGGAGGRAYLKWGDVLAAGGEEKYVVCNADESEPGTFKDREIMLQKPHLLIEGMVVAALVVGAKKGWIYIRHEYHEQIERLNDEIRHAEDMGVLGTQIFNTSESFELEVFVSPGGYICGEQTALIEAMEDKRAEPRNRPPELMTNGYRNQPTLLNNVETLAWVPAIIDGKDGEWFRDEGRKTGPYQVAGQSQKMTGRRLFSISGAVAKPGVYEVPTGIPLGELIDKYAGGMAAGENLAAVALSGPSGGLLPARIPVSELNPSFVEQFVPPETSHLDVRHLPLDINVSRAVGYMLGAGIVIYGDKADLLSEIIACSKFFRNESCGKCVPCRIGSEKVTQIGMQLLSGGIDSRQLPVLGETVIELGGVMESTSICGLGQVASNPMRSLFRFFPEIAAAACRGN